MWKDRSFLAVIPARGGSKRLPGKNIAELNGKPLIAWTIEAALNSANVTETVVSTDDPKIVEVARRYGANVPFVRPDDLATDSTPTFDVIKHALEFYASIGKKYDFLILLQPTSPLRSASHIDDAVHLLKVKGADAIVSVSQMDHSPYWSNTLPQDDSLSAFLKDGIQNVPSQALETYYRLNGAIYICNSARLLKEKTLLLKDNIFAYRMDKKSSIDIDDAIDLLFARSLIQARHIGE